MAFDRFLIAPLQTGWDTSLKPWLIPDDAFALLRNAYVFRGRVRKRFGSILMGSGTAAQEQLNSRLRINLGTTNGATGNFSITAPGTKWKIGQQFSVGTQVFTVWQVNGATLASAGTGTATYNTANGALFITGAALATIVYFYPAEPVMGLTIFEKGPLTNEPTYGFDTQFAYVFTAGAWQRSGSGTTPIWHGTNLDFFWATTFRASTSPGVSFLFVTNDYVLNENGVVDATDDPIWYLNSSSGAWTLLTPKFLTAGAGNFVRTARIIVPFKSRLILLNTIETDAANANNIHYPFRCRFSMVDNPLDTNAFLEITQAGALGGGKIDAPTDEAIVTAQFIKDRLIVYFERSTWELAYTNNDIIPFQWNQLNTELGSISTFSEVPFDTEVLAIASTGVHSCNGSNVQRIDNKIPDTIFQIKSKNDGTERVAGVRDFFAEMVYWAYPSSNYNLTYPNRILVYNYQNQSWAENDDCITAFGYYEQQVDTTWANANERWETANYTWNSGVISQQQRQVIAGNQQGYTFEIVADLSRNAPAMQLTNVTLALGVLTLTIVDHTLVPQEYFAIENAQGSTNLNNMIFKVRSTPDANTITAFYSGTLGGTYTGGGSVTRVSNIQVLSKQWNPYDKDGDDMFLGRIDFAVLKTGFGEVVVDYYPSASKISMVNAGTATGAIMGTSVLETKPYNALLYPLEQYQERLWHQVYFQSTGTSIQINIYMNDTQMTTPAITWSDFELQGLILHTSRAGNRIQ